SSVRPVVLPEPPRKIAPGGFASDRCGGSTPVPPPAPPAAPLLACARAAVEPAATIAAASNIFTFSMSASPRDVCARKTDHVYGRSPARNAFLTLATARHDPCAVPCSGSIGQTLICANQRAHAGLEFVAALPAAGTREACCVFLRHACDPQ